MSEIIVDNREQASELPRILSEMGFKIIFKQLAVGDYVLSQDLAIERKTIHDFIASLFDGRLFRQADDLSKNYKISIILIEGDASLVSQLLNNPKVYYGALSSLIINYNVKTVFVPTVEDSAIFIDRLAFNLKKDQRTRIIYNQKKYSSGEDYQINLVASLPGIGPKLAEKIIEKFGSPIRAFNAGITELAEVVGKARAKKIKAVLEYNRFEGKNAQQSKLYTDSEIK